MLYLINYSHIDSNVVKSECGLTVLANLVESSG